MCLPRSRKPPELGLLILTILILTHSSQPAPSYTTLVYKGCAKQPLSNPYPQTLASLFASLTPQSSKSRFAKASSAALTGLFQCRGDLSPADCHACVVTIPPMMDKLCGRVIAARIQLLGCYMLYEAAGFAQISGMAMLYKSCSRKTAGAGAGFEEKRDTALSALENGVGGGAGFFTTSFGDVYALGQCEGDVGAADCAECVRSAVQRAQVECGGAVGGQIYLHRCFIGYSYYANGLPKRGSPSSPSSYSSGGGPDTGKTVAIILGGAAGIGFFVICLLFARGLIKKKDDY
ncbi:Cysteine-rich repeat secretory protein 11 [Striga hermonthica]|uniref:Cysteine-rich repeat secretory protein 11 n=1 Tax=Striga hermonthica TaxID=68872 RepID=A0A9N7NCH2_STRHE|nr:Cysteine-rich repeat secretory protein 11 [Striga hermonthica]